ncbi:hypothetical protein QUB00_34600 [Microcoleus sp. F8_C2]
MENLAGQTAVRIPTRISSASGTIVRQEGQTYTVLTIVARCGFQQGRSRNSHRRRPPPPTAGSSEAAGR